MPLIQKLTYGENSAIGIWQMAEDMAVYAEHPYIDPPDGHSMVHGRLKEWMASRYLLYQLLEDESCSPIIKDDLGKPHLADGLCKISLSHSHELVAASYADVNNGIDIQKMVPKIIRIRHKYMHNEELNDLIDIDDIITLHTYWGAKEAIYKAYGKRKVDFKNDIRLKAFNSNETEGETIAYLRNESVEELYNINWKIINDEYMLVYAELLL